MAIKQTTENGDFRIFKNRICHSLVNLFEQKQLVQNPNFVHQRSGSKHEAVDKPLQRTHFKYLRLILLAFKLRCILIGTRLRSLFGAGGEEEKSARDARDALQVQFIFISIYDRRMCSAECAARVIRSREYY